MRIVFQAPQTETGGPSKTINIRKTSYYRASVKKKWTLKNTIVLEAQFGLVLNWASIAQGGRRSTVIEVMYILVQE